MCASFIKDWMIYGAKTLRITAVMSANVTSIKMSNLMNARRRSVFFAP